MQIRDLNSGTFGFVQLAKDKHTGELIACKFIERGDKVCISFLPVCLSIFCAGLHPTVFLGLIWHDPQQPSRGLGPLVLLLQVTKYVEREILNHRCLVHPHIVQFKEVSRIVPDCAQLQCCWT